MDVNGYLLSNNLMTELPNFDPYLCVYLCVHIVFLPKRTHKKVGNVTYPPQLMKTPTFLENKACCGPFRLKLQTHGSLFKNVQIRSILSKSSVLSFQQSGCRYLGYLDSLDLTQSSCQAPMECRVAFAALNALMLGYIHCKNRPLN